MLFFCSCVGFLFHRLLKVRCPSCWLARLSGKQRFLIPVNVLNLVYNQTVLWAGLFYCPLLPLLGTVKLVTLFYFKKVLRREEITLTNPPAVPPVSLHSCYDPQLVRRGREVTAERD